MTEEIRVLYPSTEAVVGVQVGETGAAVDFMPLLLVVAGVGALVIIVMAAR